MSTIKERFSMFAKKENMTLTALQESLGVSNAYVSNISKGIGRNVAKRICELYPHLNIEWLENGVGDMYIQTPKVEIKQINLVSSLNASSNVGNLINADNCEKIPPYPSNAQIALTVTGDAMSPDYSNGDIVFIAKCNTVIFGQDYIIETNDTRILRKVFEHDEDNYICSSTDKDKYPDFTIKKSDVRSVYRILSCLKVK